ncbi:zinc-binding oxidoreductase CipB [Xylariomycetidae sp. FL2044]|nr:zinc-binding oxidoreductase CipB [Xylariomycetidae sp. FL2044]
MAPINYGAYIEAPMQRPIVVREAPYPQPGHNQLLIRTKAVAMNPADGAMLGMDLFKLVYPAIGGTDVAGEVVEVGAGVTRFKPGDRVCAMATGVTKKVSAESAFQEYMLTNESHTTRIVGSMSYADACTIPLCFATAAASMYQKDFMALRYPSPEEPPVSAPGSEVILVWGGASNVGLNAIQLGVASGYEVVTTCSPKNFDMVKKFGASAVFDYNSATVVADVIAALKKGGKKFAGCCDAVAVNGAFERQVEIAGQLDGSKFIATVRPRPEGEVLDGGVTAKFAWATSIFGNEVGEALVGNFLPRALELGKYQTCPALVVGNGLDKVEGAIDRLAEGVSGQKVVVTLE